MVSDAVDWMLLTLSGQVPQDFIVERLLQQFCQTTSSVLCNPRRTVLTFDLFLFR